MSSDNHEEKPEMVEQIKQVTERPRREDSFQKEATEIFQSLTGYRVRSLIDSRGIVLIALVGLIIAFLLYLVASLIVNPYITEFLNEHKKNQRVVYPFYTFGELSFWFGMTILTVPTTFYTLAFATYMMGLYDARLTEVLKLLSLNKELRKHFYSLFRVKFDKIEKGSRKTLFSRLKNHVPNNPHLREVYEIKSSIMAELMQKLLVRMDGATVSGYFFPIILLQFIVSASFIIPSIEFTQLNTVGINVLIVSCKSSQAIGTCVYLSFWPITCGILGAFVYSIISLMERIPRRDITPRYFLSIGLRYVYTIALSVSFFLVYYEIYIQSDFVNKSDQIALSLGVIALTCFFTGLFPKRYIRVVGAIIHNITSRNLSKNISLEKFTGITAGEITRLWEEGIENVDQLADSSVQVLYRKTRIDPNRLKGLVGRALLWKYVFGIENMQKIIDEVGVDRGDRIEEGAKDIQSFPFPDIQSLCAFMFSKPID